VPESESHRVHNDATSSDHVPTLVAHVFRRWHARITATLVRALGGAQLDAVEDAVQEALLAALQHWPYRGTPERPEAWLYQVARRKLLDRFARDGTAKRAHELQEATPDRFDRQRLNEHHVDTESPLGDDELTMLFLCAHPALSVDAQMTLMLRTACGLTVDEIAAALLTPATTIAQRLVRAKRTLAQLDEPLITPELGIDAMRMRLPVVLHAIYLLFTEGYAATHGDSVVRHELCREGVRLASALAATETGSTPHVFALCALLEFQSSRLAARERVDGTTVPLAQQDRSLWDAAAVSRGFMWLSRASSGDAISDYHLQAAIAAEHAITINGAETNWPRIRLHYERLLARTDSPIVRLNHALAVARTDGACDALRLLEPLETDSRLAANHLLPAMQAVLFQEVGEYARATECTRIALTRARTLSDQALLAARLAELAPEITSV
jgi:RNA polymerase sigma-70 factor (ECF subfamily)